jgi:hypothetical protein
MLTLITSLRAERCASRTDTLDFVKPPAERKTNHVGVDPFLLNFSEEENIAQTGRDFLICEGSVCVEVEKYRKSSPLSR